MEEVQNRTQYPWSAIAYIVATFPSGDSVTGTGTVVGKNDVLTAAHVIYNADFGGYATSISIYPGADLQPFNAPLGVTTDWGHIDVRGTQFSSTGAMADAWGDLAVIGTFSALGNVTGTLGLWSTRGNVTGTIAAYPDKAAGMMTADVTGTFKGDLDLFDVPLFMGNGGAGAPLFIPVGNAYSVVGVLTGQEAGHMWFADISSPGTSNWLTSAISDNDVLLLPLTAGTPGPDKLTGSPFTADQIWGNEGNDTLTGGFGNDYLAGGTGIDTAVFTGTASGYSVTDLGEFNVHVTDFNYVRDGTDTLTSIERLSFSDKSLAIDLDGNAGLAAKFIGVVFGAAALSNPYLVHSALNYVDQGLSDLKLMDMALSVQLGAGRSNESVVNLLFTNVMGHAPSAGELGYFKGLLDTGAYTQASLGIYAADSTYNLNHINFSSIELTGLAYQ